MVTCLSVNKNRTEGAAKQGERAFDREALVIKAKWRKSGGCAMKECVLTWGDLASCLTSPQGAGQPKAGPERSEGCAKRTKGDRATWSEKSAEVVVVADGTVKARSLQQRAKREGVIEPHVDVKGNALDARCRGAGGRSMGEVVQRLRPYLLGWKAYFGLANARSLANAG